MADKMMRIAGRDAVSGTAKALRTDSQGNLGVQLTGSNLQGTGVTTLSLNAKGKVRGRTFDVPHVFGLARNATSLSPTPFSNWTELSDSNYLSVSEIDGATIRTTTSVANERSQNLFSFNILAALKNKGLIPASWSVNELSTAIQRLEFQWVGYGTAPTNGATLNRWASSSNSWAVVNNNTSNSPTSISSAIGSGFRSHLDDNGVFHLQAQTTTASNGTAASDLYTDFVSVTVFFKVDYQITDNARSFDEDTRAQRVVIKGEMIQKIDSLNSKMEQLESRITDVLNAQGTQGIMTQSQDFVPVRDMSTKKKLSDQREQIKQAYLHSEKVLSDGTMSGWVTKAQGTIAADSSSKESGISSLKLTAGDVQFSPHRVIPTTSLKDDTHIRLWVGVDNSSDLDFFRIIINAPDSSNQFIFNFAGKIIGHYGVPSILSLHKNEATTYGNPSWDAAVTQFYIAIKATTGKTVNAWVDNITFQRSKPSRGKVIIRFDDGLKSQYDVARPVLEDYGIPANCFVNPALIMGGTFTPGFGGTKQTMTIDELKYLQTLGWDISSHTWAHKLYNNRTYQQAYNDLRATQNWLIENGFGAGARFHVYGNYARNKDTLKAAHEMFLLDNSYLGGYETLPFADTSLYCLGGDNRTFDELKVLLDEIANRKTLGVIVFHRFEQEGTSDYSVEPAVWQQFISHLASRDDIDCITYTDLVDRTDIALR